MWPLNWGVHQGVFKFSSSLYPLITSDPATGHFILFSDGRQLRTAYWNLTAISLFMVGLHINERIPKFSSSFVKWRSISCNKDPYFRCEDTSSCGSVSLRVNGIAWWNFCICWPSGLVTDEPLADSLTVWPLSVLASGRWRPSWEVVRRAASVSSSSPGCAEGEVGAVMLV